VRCGTPIANTVIVDYAGTATPACLYGGAPKHLSVIEMSTGNAALVTADWRPSSIDGVPTEETDRHSADGDHERLVSFPDRHLTVTITSADPAVIDTARSSMRVTDTDPETGCVVHTNAYDDGKPDAQGDSHELLPGDPTNTRACVYVSGWLERSEVVGGSRMTALADAIRAAPPTTDRRAPDDTNCESVADMQTPSDNPPMVLHFDYADSSTWTLVAKTSWCTRWQSTISSGDVTRRIDQRLLLTLPQLWTSYPDPDSMDLD
jgi:hypothetical protein